MLNSPHTHTHTHTGQAHRRQNPLPGACCVPGWQEDLPHWAVYMCRYVCVYAHIICTLYQPLYCAYYIYSLSLSLTHPFYGISLCVVYLYWCTTHTQMHMCCTCPWCVRNTMTYTGVLVNTTIVFSLCSKRPSCVRNTLTYYRLLIIVSLWVCWYFMHLIHHIHLADERENTSVQRHENTSV